MDKKVLIADDEPNILILMEQALEKLEEDHNIELIMANNGKDALKIIIDEKPNLVFLDIMMPKMSGLDVCQAVKKDLNLADIYIVILTAKGQEFDRRDGLAKGADLYMTKPFRPKEVLNKSLEILGLV
ncbi:MAG: Alkaline phosphatase synthesis transcriptional regulatory protein PhoP [Chroococcopsis gigantea SAG 12.99]|jgi:two-component system alkaline phosphatase synthesis response regulator PhoP|nr:response regulator [Chlorogloea purpurea SAG 13.99]MDV3001546.1 Alkaline phosphatase synthesis transcriptional regulatory protein PhoP [Chroococcopsis gigantea SAG 12.99]